MLSDCTCWVIDYSCISINCSSQQEMPPDLRQRLQFSNLKDKGPGHTSVSSPAMVITLLREEVSHSHGYLRCSIGFHQFCGMPHILQQLTLNQLFKVRAHDPNSEGGSFLLHSGPGQGQTGVSWCPCCVMALLLICPNVEDVALSFPTFHTCFLTLCILCILFCHYCAFQKRQLPKFHKVHY